MKTLIRGGIVVTDKSAEVADLLIDGEKIAAVGENLPAEGAEVIDATGKLVFPGFIDAHTHMDLPVCNTITADSFETGTKAALLGGTTCLVDFATQEAGETLQEGLDHWREKAVGKSSCDFAFHMAISQWRPDIREELPSMFRQGITSFKLYMTYGNQVNDREMYEILSALKPLGGIVGVHCENSGIIDARTAEVKASGVTGPTGHPLSRPDEAEAEAINRLLTIARLVDVPVIVVHLSTKKGMKVIRRARKKGQKVFVESCPHYLLLDDRCYAKPGFEGAKYICSPPLRREEDEKCLWKALEEDEIQTISTDHCSFTMEQKQAGMGDFTKIPGGMPGVEERVSLMYTYGVEEGRISLTQLVKHLSTLPAKLYGMYPRKGALEVGSDADIVIFDPNARQTITAARCHNAAGYTPYEGWGLTGKVETVYLRGRRAADQGEVIAPHLGEYIPRTNYQL